MNEREIKEYKKFMYNPENMYNCSACLENKGMENKENPCG